MENFTPTAYTLKCVATGHEFDDAGWTLEYKSCTEPSLIRTIYAKKQLGVKDDSYGLYKFCDWLPVNRMLKGSAAPVTYRSEGLARHLGLDNLSITLNGYYPERGAAMTTCSFKETEAYSVCGRTDPNEDRILVVASAGNTARAFAKVCSENNIRLLLSVPADNLSAMWFDKPLAPCVKLIACERGGDYFDAIRLGDMLLKSPRFYAEGGAKNVARRDVSIIDAKVLSNRKPPYSLRGGLYDALKATDGDVLTATNAQVRRALRLFEETEGIDIHPAAGVALASLIKQVADGKIARDACIMLNITGAGEKRFREEHEPVHLEPSCIFPLDVDADKVVADVEALFD